MKTGFQSLETMWWDSPQPSYILILTECWGDNWDEIETLTIVGNYHDSIQLNRIFDRQCEFMLEAP